MFSLFFPETENYHRNFFIVWLMPKLGCAKCRKNSADGTPAYRYDFVWKNKIIK